MTNKHNGLPLDVSSVKKENRFKVPSERLPTFSIPIYGGGNTYNYNECNPTSFLLRCGSVASNSSCNAVSLFNRSDFAKVKIPQNQQAITENGNNVNYRIQRPVVKLLHNLVQPLPSKNPIFANVKNKDRSAFADMLHDTERNQKYFLALKEAIEIIHDQGKKANVLDIGTGTGLLSLMAIQCGADTVTACEAFEPMANCASEVIKDNGAFQKIKLIKKRSTDMTVGPDCDMPQRANILVTEVFDTELIGEGALRTFHHAHKCLLEEDCIVVPSAANLYVQIVDSDYIRKWNEFKPVKLNNKGLEISVPPSIQKCPGNISLHDLQLTQLSSNLFNPITEPVKVFRFDFSGKSKIIFSNEQEVDVTSQTTGNCDALFMWWDLEMDTKAKCILNCAPKWAHPEPESMQWRDHWMQAIYYPRNNISVRKGDNFTVKCFHDEYSLWFDVCRPGCEKEGDFLQPSCVCGVHNGFNRSRIGLINEIERTHKFMISLSKVINSDSVCLTISDGTLLSIIAAKLGAKHVYALEPERVMSKMIQEFIEHNDLKDTVTVISKRSEDVTADDFSGFKPNVIIGEPHFLISALPWHNIHFWYSRTELSKLLDNEVKVLPCCATMRAVAVEFDDLWKIRSPVRLCEGFDLQTFDNLIENSSDIADNNVEPHSLWEYPCKPMSEQFSLLTFDFTKKISELRTVNRQGYINLTNVGKCNAVCIWMDYHFGQKTIISTGLKEPPKRYEYLDWEPNHKQGVHLLKVPINVTGEDTGKLRMQYYVTFRPQTGDFEFFFNVTR